jgi:beta-lactamase regulating signal transducer with metallopeptidase domain
MTALYNSPFLIALGWTIASSLWQTALLWLICQLAGNIDKRNNPSLRHALAALAMGISFCWFAITLVQNYSAIIHLTQSIAGLSALNEDAAKALFAAQTGISRSSFFELLSTYLPYFSTAYLIVLLILLIKLVNAYLFSRKLRTEGLYAAEPQWVNYINRYAAYLGITRKVELFFSEYVNVPATLDFFKPVILIPVAAFNHLTPQQVESILLHELAHIRRNDYLINIIVSVIETILFFNPFVHLLGKTIRKEREHCCDDLVLRYNTDAHSYASALLSLEKMRIGIPSIAVAATGNDNQLLGRVKRIMNVKTTNFNYGQKLFAFVFIAFLLISIAWLSPDQHINNAKQRNEQPAVKSSTGQNNKYTINNSTKIIDTEKNMTVSAPAQKTFTISRRIISGKDTLHITTTSASIPLPLPAVPKPALPPVPPPAPALFNNPDQPGVAHHFEMPEFTAPELIQDNLTPYSLSLSPNTAWATIQDNFSKALSAEQVAAQKKLGRQLLLLNDRIKSFDTASSKALLLLLKQADDQRMLNDRQLELLVQQQLRTASLFRQKQSPDRDRAANRKSIIAENQRRMDSVMQKQERIRKKTERPSLWIYNKPEKKSARDRGEWLAYAGNADSYEGKAPAYHAEYTQSTTFKIAPSPDAVSVTAAKNGFASGIAHASQTDYAVRSNKEDSFEKKLIITDESGSGTLVITIQ